MGRFIQRLKQTFRVMLLHFTFHNHLASLVVSRIKLLLSPPKNYRRIIIQEFINHFGDVADRSGKDDSTMIKEILYGRSYYAMRDKDYFHFGLDLSMGKEKNDYVCWLELLHYFECIAKRGSKDLFDRKEMTYEKFRPFYCRELVYVASEDDRSLFNTFFKHHQLGIVKPAMSMGGEGIKRIALTDQLSLDQLWESVHMMCPFVLEELIQQAPEMDAIYPYSVNTVRFTTFFHEGKLTKMQATLRMGRDGNSVDNATQGGLFVPVDINTGRIMSPARDYLCKVHSCHPNTGIPFEGTCIPRWNELNALVEEVAQVFPKQELVGWDFALSKKGWVMVEGNWNPGLQCFDPEHGLRKLVKETIGTVVPMWN